MAAIPDNPSSAPAGSGNFATTHWSVVVAARDRATPEAREAMTVLARTYWYPLYAFIRRQGHPADQAQDLTQEFFTRLLEKNALGLADQSRGRFRSFLLAACKNFLANEHDRVSTQKRGGGRTFVSIDFGDAESQYGLEPAHNLTPETLFERRWALALLQEVLRRLREEYAAKGKGSLFECLRHYLVAEPSAGPYVQAAASLGMSEGAVKVAVHRLRQRYREMLREAIAQTIDTTTPEEIEEEIRQLFRALGS
jgi:RNA polymerase sigma-70 factor (ECF subfamily)